MKITLKHFLFEISSPYSAGHRLTQVEAQALNGLRAENIRNSAGKALAKLVDARRLRHEPMPEMLSSEEQAGLQQLVAQLDSAYEFQGKAQPRAKSGTLDAEIRLAAEEWVEAELRRTGTQLSSSEFEALVAEKQRDHLLVAEGRRRLEARLELNKRTMMELFA